MQLDYFNGRRIESVSEANDDGASWVINLEHGGTILVFDDSYEMPTGLDGLALTQVRLSAEGTQAVFGDDQNPYASVVNLPPTNYAVKDDNYTGGAVEYPQRSGMEGLSKAEADEVARVLNEDDDDGA